MAEQEEQLEDVGDLEIDGIIGFDGHIISGLLVHPKGTHIIFPIGNKVCIQDWSTKKQDFMAGHTNMVSAVDVSTSGKYVASGQINHIGFKALVIIWDFESRTLLAKHELHKVRVEQVRFSCDDNYVISLGGRDCGNVIVWDIPQGQPLSGTAATRGVQGDAYCLLPTHRRGACFITGGDNNLSVWKIDKDARNVKGIDVSVSKIKRIIYCMDLDERDEMCFCGTSTGDVFKIRLQFHHDVEILDPVKNPIMIGCFSKIPRRKKKNLPSGSADLYGCGVRSIRIFHNGTIAIGAGDGTLDLVKEHIQKPTEEEKNALIKSPSIPGLQVLKSTNVKGAVTSIQLMNNESVLLVGTWNCEIFYVNVDTFSPVLIVTCHLETIYDIAFPHKFSDVFATASKEDVRVWNLQQQQEMLRIKVANFICSCVRFSFDGKSILTGWNDGVIRSFTPQTGRLIYAIFNAHNKGVSALETTSHGRILVTGGCEGQVRLWDVSPYRQQLLCVLKEHKGPVSAVHVNKTDDEAVSASTDGTCIIWDIIRQCRKQILFANTLFMSVKYYPSGVQILTAGTDHKLSYWEVLDGSLVRELEGSPSGAINTVDISCDGSLFVTGGNDQVVKLWKYQEGITTHIGLGHSAVITKSIFSPDGKHIVTTSASGSIFIWKNPIDISCEEKSTEDTPKTDGEETVRGLGNGDKKDEKPKCICPYKISVKNKVNSNNVKC